MNCKDCKHLKWKVSKLKDDDAISDAGHKLEKLKEKWWPEGVDKND